MPYKCAVFNCDMDLENENVKLHRFPLQDEKRLPRWILVVNRGPQWTPKPHSRICSSHFQNPIYDRRKRLLTDPTPRMLEKTDYSPPPKLFKKMTFSQIVVPIDKNLDHVQVIQGGGIRVGEPKSSSKSSQTCCIQKVSSSTQTSENRRTAESNELLIRRLNVQITKQKLSLLRLKAENRIAKVRNKADANVLRKIRYQTNNGILTSMLTRMQLKKSYDSTTRQFAMTLYFHSTEAYKFVRSNLGNMLPSVRTIQKWNEEIVTQPGFSPSGSTEIPVQMGSSLS